MALRREGRPNRKAMGGSRRAWWLWGGLAGAVAVLVVVVIVVLLARGGDEGGSTTSPLLAPSYAQSLGSPNAPVTFVEFSDFR